MDQDLSQMLREIRDDVKELLPLKQEVARHELLLYGNGHEGLLTKVDNLQTAHKVYNKIFGAMGTLVAAVFGDAFWRHVK